MCEKNKSFCCCFPEPVLHSIPHLSPSRFLAMLVANKATRTRLNLQMLKNVKHASDSYWYI